MQMNFYNLYSRGSKKWQANDELGGVRVRLDGPLAKQLPLVLECWGVFVLVVHAPDGGCIHLKQNLSILSFIDLMI
jgi:hypothetical protein